MLESTANQSNIAQQRFHLRLIEALEQVEHFTFKEYRDSQPWRVRPLETLETLIGRSLPGQRNLYLMALGITGLIDGVMMMFLLPPKGLYYLASHGPFWTLLVATFLWLAFYLTMFWADVRRCRTELRAKVSKHQESYDASVNSILKHFENISKTLETELEDLRAMPNHSELVPATPPASITTPR